MVQDTFRRFAEERVKPVAEHVHRHNEDIPEDVRKELECVWLEKVEEAVLPLGEKCRHIRKSKCKEPPPRPIQPTVKTSFHLPVVIGRTFRL